MPDERPNDHRSRTAQRRLPADQQRLQEAVEAAEHAAFMRWQHAYGAYEIACDDAFGAPNHGVSVYLGRCRYCAVPLLTIGSLSEDCRGGGPFLEVPEAKL